jgi:hypothetical protein
VETSAGFSLLTLVGLGAFLSGLVRFVLIDFSLFLAATLRGGTLFFGSCAGACAGFFSGRGSVLSGCVLALLRVQFYLNFLALLATVRGGTSFLFPTAKKKQKQRKRLSTIGYQVSRACSFKLLGTSEKRSIP